MTYAALSIVLLLTAPSVSGASGVSAVSAVSGEAPSRGDEAIPSTSVSVPQADDEMPLPMAATLGSLAGVGVGLAVSGLAALVVLPAGGLIALPVLPIVVLPAAAALGAGLAYAWRDAPDVGPVVAWTWAGGAASGLVGMIAGGLLYLAPPARDLFHQHVTGGTDGGWGFVVFAAAGSLAATAIGAPASTLLAASLSPADVE